VISPSSKPKALSLSGTGKAPSRALLGTIEDLWITG